MVRQAGESGASRPDIAQQIAADSQRWRHQLKSRQRDRPVACPYHKPHGQLLTTKKSSDKMRSADGSIAERTAWLSQPYIGFPDYSALQVTTRGKFRDIFRKAQSAGGRLANGDSAIVEILGVYEHVQREIPRHDPRFRIDCCALLNELLIQRMRAFEAIPAPFSYYVYFQGGLMRFYGEERTRHMFPMRDFLAARLRPADASYHIASPSDPMMWLRSQITRTNMNGNVWGTN
jgi:predicted amidohydrolase YtcJ